MQSKPTDINDSRIIKRTGIVQDIICEKIPKAYKNLIHISGEGLLGIHFYLEGECDVLKAMLKEKLVTAYGYKPFLNKEGFVTAQVEINNEILIGINHSNNDTDFMLLLFMAFAPILIVGSLTVGFYQGKWGHNA